ncbi:MAG: hypothetical protein IJK90_06360, partial [Bacteroidales bacterium]|nr:hypothetical protein [Bacteroidales bacterium]
ILIVLKSVLACTCSSYSVNELPFFPKRAAKVKTFFELAKLFVKFFQKLLLHLSAASCQITFFPNGTAKVVIILTKQTFFRFFFKKRQNNLG